MEQIEHQIVAILTEIIQGIGWYGVVVLMALESANIPIPSEIIMPLAGWMLVEETGGSLWQAFWIGGFFGALGCTIGSVVSYYLGAYGGRPFVERYGRYIMVTPHDLQQADRWFGRWGDWAVFISRMLPIVRTFISFPAGVTRVNLPKFIVLTFVGSFLWCGALAAGGYVFGANWEELRAMLRPFDIPIAIAIVLGLIWYVRRHLAHSRSGSPPLAAGPAED